MIGPCFGGPSSKWKPFWKKKRLWGYMRLMTKILHAKVHYALEILVCQYAGVLQDSFGTNSTDPILEKHLNRFLKDWRHCRGGLQRRLSTGGSSAV